MRTCTIGILAAAAWVAALCGQELPAPKRLPEVKLKPSLAIKMRDILQSASEPNNVRCAIRLLEVPVNKKVEPMPVERPPATIDNMQVKVPAPPCPEEKR